MKKLLLNNNIHLLIKDIESAIKEGYYLTDKSFLVSVNGLHQIELYKEDRIFALMADEDFPPKVEILSYEAVNVLKGIQPYIVNGYLVEEIDWMELGYKYMSLDKPTHSSYRVFTKEELNEMSYDALKEHAKVIGAFHRSKDQMIRNILKIQEEKQ